MQCEGDTESSVLKIILAPSSSVSLSIRQNALKRAFREPKILFITPEINWFNNDFYDYKVALSMRCDITIISHDF